MNPSGGARRRRSEEEEERGGGGGGGGGATTAAEPKEMNRESEVKFSNFYEAMTSESRNRRKLFRLFEALHMLGASTVPYFPFVHIVRSETRSNAPSEEKGSSEEAWERT